MCMQTKHMCVSQQFSVYAMLECRVSKSECVSQSVGDGRIVQLYNDIKGILFFSIRK